MNESPRSPFDLIDNPRHSTKKELRSSSVGQKLYPKPPKVAAKKLNMNLSYSTPRPLTEARLSSYYDEKIPVSYFEQVFESISKIGEGSFGKVFKVRSRSDGELYAVKILKDRVSLMRMGQAKRVEVDNHRRVEYHKHCITLYNAWEQDDEIFLQMELGRTSLDHYTASHPNISEKRLWNILLDMLLALKHLHDANLIHVDVKLQNIIMFNDGSCKLGDFGLLLDIKGDKKYATEGDAKYVAPELLHGKYSKAADVFSLGISMLELAGDLELPANGKLWHNLREGIFPEMLNDRVSKELLNFIRRMMRKDYKKRPSINTLLKHPRLKSLMKKRREESFASIYMQEGDEDSKLDNNPDFPTSPDTNPTVNITMATPPLGYSTPDMTTIFNEYDANGSLPNEPLSCVELPKEIVKYCRPYCNMVESKQKTTDIYVINSSAKKLNFLH